MVQSTGSALLDGDGKVRDSQTARKYFDTALKAEQRGDRHQAIEAYEAAYAADPDDDEVCFRLAYCLDLVGEEDEALHLYEQASQLPTPRLNVLINLAIMYEDKGMYAQAERCIRQVLATEPNHARARLYLKDVIASRGMVIEEEPGVALERNSALLETPVTDFDLSVRARNALRKMNIRTLADLLRVTEAELRNFKNFGEASLDEIKRMLAQRGLRLGQALDVRDNAAKKAVYDQLKTNSGSDDEALNRNVAELNLSVRARKALALLNVQSLADLCMRTEAELMGVKNFGMTSLLEIKNKLTDMGLSLRKLEA
ncbi:MAG: tetratricopeptide repeat protein [Planctomycetes bacterium]|nr:tetratricopeptide repeat protein [Planctomycetota bacterium]